jgi:hypothetical protein
VRYMETIPGFDTLDELPWYPERTYPGVIGRAQRELRSRTGAKVMPADSAKAARVRRR